MKKVKLMPASRLKQSLWHPDWHLTTFVYHNFSILNNARCLQAFSYYSAKILQISNGAFLS